MIKILQFVILFYNNKSLSFRGIYGVIPQTNDFIHIYGRGNKIYHLKETPILSFLKYSSSMRTFTEIPTKSLTATTDAISIDPSKLKK